VRLHLDHIATEIESIIDESQFSFEENLKKVFAKWKNELTPSSSFLEITNQFLR
jgi:hypothetical protein